MFNLKERKYYWKIEDQFEKINVINLHYREIVTYLTLWLGLDIDAISKYKDTCYRDKETSFPIIHFTTSLPSETNTGNIGHV